MTPEFGTPRTAIVTGGAKRIGAALSRALAADGWDVLVHYNSSPAEAQALAEEIGGRTVQADLAGEDVGERIVGAAASPPGLLVNNASRFDWDTHDDFTTEGWRTHMDVNLRAPALLGRAFAQAVPEGAKGLIVNMLDVKLFAPNPDFFTYTISKYGLMGLTELQARALAPRIRVNGIAPAVTMVSGPQSRENFAKVHAHNPLGRGVTADDLVAALRYLVASPVVTGQVLTVDGGQRMMGMPRDVQFMVTE
jgi:NAD(P)-dependent dehydrogenase (short-subunit alcohol dehydrogenase family)